MAVFSLGFRNLGLRVGSYSGSGSRWVLAKFVRDIGGSLCRSSFSYIIFTITGAKNTVRYIEVFVKSRFPLYYYPSTETYLVKVYDKIIIYNFALFSGVL